MSLPYFQKLALKAQITIVEHCGIPVTKRQESNYTISLFIVKDYYVELYYYGDETSPQKVIAFKSPDQLSPYLDQFDITPLLQEDRRL